jgi:hypothetical protein
MLHKSSNVQSFERVEIIMMYELEYRNPLPVLMDVTIKLCFWSVVVRDMNPVWDMDMCISLWSNLMNVIPITRASAMNVLCVQ